MTQPVSQVSQDDTASAAASAPAGPGPELGRARLGLSGKLLMLTILFVMLAEVLIYVPSIATFRMNWLNDRLAAAHTAALVLDAAPSGMVPESLARQILSSVGARAVAMKMGTQRRLLAVSDMPLEVQDEIDMRDMPWHRAVVDAFRTLLCGDDDAMRVVGPAPMGGDFLEIVMDEKPLRQAMIRFSTNILLISLLISGITAMLVYFALHYLLVRPMRRITANMMAFRADPENPRRVISVSKRRDEIGLAENELASMQIDLSSMLQQKSRLAALGLAVSKINHDLRNLLTSAQLFSEGLTMLPDPRVQRFAPKMMRALERAIAFCESTLSYGRAQEPPPDRLPVALEPIVEEVRETLALADSRIGWITAIERDLIVDADPDQLLRVLLNLARNAVQALETRAPNDPSRDQVRITGRREGAVVIVELSDTGPGFQAKAREHLFEPFQSSARSGGTGLGLVIAGELVRAHGGEIALAEGTIGATFQFTIPDRAVDLESRRPARARA
jgi:signal transduction histidine kinase